MSEKLFSFIDRHRQAVESALEGHLPLSHQTHAVRLNEALRYAIFPGGKRWRPMLTLLGAQLANPGLPGALAAACAMEFLHTSSIVLDDLPSMDDADQRRGRHSLHVAFGESIALLAALALLNQSYGLLISACSRNGVSSAGPRLVEEAARCIGSNGMIGGQVVDLELKGNGQRPEALESRNLKTSALMRLTLIAGAVCCGAGENDALILGNFGESLGTAYQICDDLLDELCPGDELGKPAGQDLRHGRLTHVAEHGPEGALRIARHLIDEGTQSLRDHFGECEAVELLNDSANLILKGSGRLTVVAA